MIESRVQFVDSLGQILSSSTSPVSSTREPVQPSVFRLRKVVLRAVYAVIALAILGLLAVYFQNL
ncbi:MAG TPA: hypothetical protein QF694_05435 [Dehalococcoidia bacterium]|nr:hypothetical protein [Dehalococcoidia bacterium]